MVCASVCLGRGGGGCAPCSTFHTVSVGGCVCVWGGGYSRRCGRTVLLAPGEHWVVCAFQRMVRENAARLTEHHLCRSPLLLTPCYDMFATPTPPTVFLQPLPPCLYHRVVYGLARLQLHLPALLSDVETCSRGQLRSATPQALPEWALAPLPASIYAAPPSLLPLTQFANTLPSVLQDRVRPSKIAAAHAAAAVRRGEHEPGPAAQCNTPGPCRVGSWPCPLGSQT